jgi:hypothetical protein
MATARERTCHNRFIVFIVLLSFLVIGMSSLSSAQEVPRLDVFGGYSFLRLDSTTFGFADYSNLNGWNADLTGNITRQWSVTLDASGDYGHKLDVVNFMIGPQYEWRKDNSRFFVHGLFGKAQNRVDIVEPELAKDHIESVGRAIAAGAGYDRDITERFTFRVQADYLRTDTFSTTQNDVRVSTGLVFHFGHVGKKPKL